MTRPYQVWRLDEHDRPLRWVGSYELWWIAAFVAQDQEGRIGVCDGLAPALGWLVLRGVEWARDDSDRQLVLL